MAPALPTRPDRPRAERRVGVSVLIDRDAGYYREMTRAQLAALGREIATLLELDIACEGTIPG
jgi:hypothetical protein